MQRRLFSIVAVAIFLVLLQPRARADDVAVPIRVQASLLGKVAAYDRAFRARAGSTAHVLIVSKGTADARHVAAEMLQELRNLPDIGGLPHDERSLKWTSAGELALECRRARAAIVYMTSDFEPGEIGAVARALAGVNVLSVAYDVSYVPLGVVLGFQLSSGHPKMWANLPQARVQFVDFEASVLNLMKVVRGSPMYDLISM